MIFGYVAFLVSGEQMTTFSLHFIKGVLIPLIFCDKIKLRAHKAADILSSKTKKKTQTKQKKPSFRFPFFVEGV
jgi:ribosomal protein L13